MYREYTMMAHEETTRFLAYATFVNIYYTPKACKSVFFVRQYSLLTYG